MKFIDMLQTSAVNLWKRKLRSALTIMGVVIGVASIMVMISLGLGLSRSMMDEYSSYGSMTQITVNAPYSSDSAEGLRLNNALIEDLKKLDHVENVFPVLESSAISIAGPYSAYLNIRGMPVEALANLDIKVGDGSLPTEKMQDLEFFYGKEVAMNYTNTKTGKGYWDTGIIPDIDFYNGGVFTVFDMDAYYASQSGTSTSQPKKYLVPTCGTQLNDESFSMYSWYVYCDIDKLESTLKKIYKNKVIPGQPTTKSGKPYKEIFYSEIDVDVDEMDNVSEVMKYITDLGYNASSNAEWIQSAQKSMGYVEAVLGGIGAVSLLVAAIGIANTMMMSIYERTKEIGVMKVLGCALENIRMMFLLEAGMIGFVGGILGVILSYIISYAVNFVTNGADVLGIGGGGGKLSVIPIWLVLLSIIFAILISMLAGFFPAQKAMKLSPLAAIRNE